MSHIIICERCSQRWLHDDTVVSNYCGDCAGKAFLGEPVDWVGTVHTCGTPNCKGDHSKNRNSLMNETEQLLKLSLIYTDLLQQLEDMVGVKFPSIHQAMQVVDDSVDRACIIKQSNPPLQFKLREFYKGDN